MNTKQRVGEEMRRGRRGEGDDGPDNDCKTRDPQVWKRGRCMTLSDREMNGGMRYSLDLLIKGILTSFEIWITC